MSDKINDDLIFLGRNVSKFVVAMEGNVSKKIDNGFSIKASGTKLSTLSESDIVSFDFEGKQTTNFSKKGSMEKEFHRYLLSYENVNYVSHTHPTNTVKILCTKLSKEFSDNRIFPDQVVFNEKKSCLIPYIKPGDSLSNLIKNEVSKFIEKEKFFPKLILLKNHGIISCGSTIDECIAITEICEKSAEIFLHSYVLGINYLTNEEINELLIDEKEKYRKLQL